MRPLLAVLGAASIALAGCTVSVSVGGSQTPPATPAAPSSVSVAPPAAQPVVPPPPATVTATSSAAPAPAPSNPMRTCPRTGVGISDGPGGGGTWDPSCVGQVIAYCATLTGQQQLACEQAVLYGIGEKKETVFCLEGNGVDPISALRDATDPTAHGALLDSCRTNPAYHA